ncbi:MBL fold metallo-hydrolase [Variovorax dokdonensis]|uniref:MBL fold metallo-hydrolase n=1 Tax=Variovorax dokdonensis TaxID=344883 RepID=A0ABT7NCI5_9BURK|nr:MBL fold metallo-hydrolase [Variovorax dokdonensis]MDM0045636.1 MBL fold metallo-hydrolase [Variovorax dokdonensis]
MPSLTSAALPPGVQVFERGWLSSNNILFDGGSHTALVDSGYVTHSTQTLGLVMRALEGRRLDLLVNTHLHSDHCGGNAALKAQFPELKVVIPPGEAEAVRAWDEDKLSYTATGQQCPRFEFDDVLAPGTEVELGQQRWQVHAAPGHDPHAVILFEPESRTLISGDALWERGFGVVFPEMWGEPSFAQVGATLDLIEQLQPALVIPGHGRIFDDAQGALIVARQRLEGFVAAPVKHARHAVKVLLKFKLLEQQRMTRPALSQWLAGSGYLEQVWQRYASDTPIQVWVEELLADLARAGAVAFVDGEIVDAG